MTSSSPSNRKGMFIKTLSVFSLLALAVALTAFGQEQTQQATQAPAQQPAAAPAQAQAAELPPLPLSPIEKAEKDGTALKMSLRDLTKLALQNNLDIAIQDTNEEILQLAIIAAHGAYDGTLSATLSTNKNKSINSNILDKSASGYINLNTTSRWDVSFSKQVPTGGNFQASWNSNRQNSNSESNLFNPASNATTQVSFTQPLRRNFRIDSTRNQIKIANLDLKSNDSTFKQSVTTTIANIQNQYWDLISAIRDYEIQRESVKLAQRTLLDNQKKVDVGTQPKIVIIQSQSRVAQAEVGLIRAEETILNRENALRQLISTDRNSDIWKKVIVPTDLPDFKEYKVDLDLAIDTALANRPELEQYAITLQKSDLNYRQQLNSKKWRVDLTGTFGTNAKAGPMAYDQFGNPRIDEKFVGGIGNAYKNLFVGGNYTWNISVRVDVPLGNRQVDSNLAQNRIQQRQTLMNRMKAEQQIQVEIRNAVQSLETAKRQVQVGQLSRELAEANYDAENKRFEAGLSEAYLVLQRQTEVSQAQGQELSALISYKKAIITLQRAMYTLLEANDFQLAKSASESVPALK